MSDQGSMSNIKRLTVGFDLPVQACNGGFFIVNGEGRHPNRVIDSYELIYVENSQLDIADEGGEFHICQGQYLLLYPGIRHWGLNDYKPGLRFYWLHFFLKEKNGGANRIDMAQSGVVAWPDSLIELFRRFLHSQESGSPLSAERDLLTLMLLLELMREENSNPSIGQAVLLAERANTYIQLHLAGPLNRAYLANKLGCNADYLGRVVHKVFHKSITELIHDHRYKQSLHMLQNTQMSIEEIAYRCGYSDSRTFRLQFKSRKGMAPSQYRKLFAQTHINTK